MERVKNPEGIWGSVHNSYVVDLFRVAVGVFLFMKGTFFITGGDDLENVISPLREYGAGELVQKFVTGAHLIGGIMIVFGLRTKWAALVNLPILFGAIIINFIGKMDVFNLMLSAIVFLLCLYFVFYGSGKHSADYYFQHDDDDDEEESVI